MNDDWDGLDWAGSFSGPDDDELERRHQSHYKSTQTLDQDTTESEFDSFSEDNSDSVVFREGEFSSFQDAQNYAKKYSAEYNSIFRVERFNNYWKSYEDRLYVRFDDEIEPIRIDLPCLASIELVKALRRRDRVLALQILYSDVDVDGLSFALMVAAYRGYADICERLLSLGATFEIEVAIDHNDPRRNYSGDQDHENSINTVMHQANLSRDFATIEVIGKAYVTAEWNFLKGSFTNDPSGFQYFCFPRLVEAAAYGMTGLCAEMICAGVEVNQYRDPNKFFSEPNESPLVAAFENKHKSTCLVLIALGADIRDLERSMTSMGAFKLMYEITKNFLDTDIDRTE